MGHSYWWQNTGAGGGRAWGLGSGDQQMSGEVTISGRTDGASATNHTHPIGYDGDENNRESRPDNFTKRIWKRIN